MRPTRQTLFARAAAVSAVLCAAAAVMWTRSYWADDRITYRGTSAGGMVISVAGRLYLERRVPLRRPPGWATGVTRESFPADPVPDLGPAGVHRRRAENLGWSFTWVLVPWSAVVAATAVVPAAWLAGRVRRAVREARPGGARDAGPAGGASGTTG